MEVLALAAFAGAGALAAWAADDSCAKRVLREQGGVCPGSLVRSQLSALLHWRRQPQDRV